MKRKEVTCLFIRHGQTAGNATKSYIGWTDEPLSEDGIRLLNEKKAMLSKAETIRQCVTSPLLRTKQTAAIYFPKAVCVEIEEFKELNFGDFEGMNYEMLNGNPDYQRYIDSNGTAPFPNGESQEQFKQRVEKGLVKWARMQIDEKGENTVAAVVHDGTIMAVMHLLTKEAYFNFHVNNGCGYRCELEITEEEEQVAIRLNSYLPIG